MTCLFEMSVHQMQVNFRIFYNILVLFKVLRRFSPNKVAHYTSFLKEKQNDNFFEQRARNGIKITVSVVPPNVCVKTLIQLDHCRLCFNLHIHVSFFNR